MMRRIVEERRAFPREVPYRPFVVVKPNGMPHRDEIARRLSLEGVAVAERRPIPERARSALPPANCLIRHRDALVATSLSYLHSPSEENYWIEAGLLLD